MNVGLRGVRVLDFTWAGAGAIATALLRLLGADVVKVESATRPDLLRIANRSYGWSDDADLESSASFNDISAGKRSLALNLKQPEARELAKLLAATSDVVCDNMRPGKMERLGLGYEQLAATNPRIISCSVSATGRVPNGDPSDPPPPGYAPVFWAEGGGAGVTGWPDGEPAYIRSPVDMNAGTQACLGILAAIYAREITGQGGYVDCSAIETVASTIGDELLAASLSIPAGGLRGNERPPYTPNDTFECRTPDTWIAISILTALQWNSLCDVLNVPEGVRSLGQTRLSRWTHREEIRHVLQRCIQSLDVVALGDQLRAAGVPGSESMTFRGLLDDPVLNARGFWRFVEHPILGRQQIAGLPWIMEPGPPPATAGGPLLGADTSDVLAEWLGYTAIQIARLESLGVLK